MREYEIVKVVSRKSMNFIYYLDKANGLTECQFKNVRIDNTKPYGKIVFNDEGEIVEVVVNESSIEYLAPNF